MRWVACGNFEFWFGQRPSSIGGDASWTWRRRFSTPWWNKIRKKTSCSSSLLPFFWTSPIGEGHNVSATQSRLWLSKVPKAVGQPPRWKDERLQDQSRRSQPENPQADPAWIRAKSLEDSGRKEERRRGGILSVLGLVMTYVDDIFVVGSEDVVSAVAQEIEWTWTVTEPEVVSEVPVRFLGMDILKVKEEGTEGWMINHESYVKDLVGRQVGEEKEKMIPISRDQSYMEADKDPPTLEKPHVRQEPDWLSCHQGHGRGFGNSPTSQALPPKEQQEKDCCTKKREGTHDPGFYGCLVFIRRRRKPWMFCGHAQWLPAVLAIWTPIHRHLVHCRIRVERNSRRDEWRRSSGSHHLRAVRGGSKRSMDRLTANRRLRSWWTKEGVGEPDTWRWGLATPDNKWCKENGELAAFQAKKW